MNQELEIWKFAARKLEQNESVMLLTVAESSGSSPGRQGFKMIVARDDLCGSIGGGVMEVKLVELAKSKLEFDEMQTFVKFQVHREKSRTPSGMICSGKQFVIFFKLNKSDLKTILEIINSLEINQSKTLVISSNSRKKTNTLEVSDFSETQFPNTNYYFLVKEGMIIYKEKLGYKNKLFIIGGGHCALALSEIMAKMDFHISLFDDRADLNTLAKNAFVHAKRIIESYEKIGEFIESGNNIYVVVMTLGYKFDEIVIRGLFDKNFKYFGVLGSKAKMKTLLKNLEKEGFDKEKLANIRTPIGLKINSRTPAEIAVSIAAEIIAVKNSV